MIIESIINVVFGVLINIFDFLSIPPTPQFLLNLESNILSLFSYVMPLINFLFSHSMLATALTLIYSVFLIYISYKIIHYIIQFVKGWL